MDTIIAVELPGILITVGVAVAVLVVHVVVWRLALQFMKARMRVRRGRLEAVLSNHGRNTVMPQLRKT
jgi:uncharacterized membrane protein YciS (DUF1049 family)